MLKNKLKLTRNKLLAIVAPIILALVLIGLFLPAQNVDIEGTGLLSVETRIALAASSGGTLGSGEPVPQEIISPTFVRGGPPVVSVQYNFDAIEDIEDVLIIINSYDLPAVHIPKGQLKNLPGEKSYPEIEVRVNAYVQKNCYEIWVLLSSLSSDDRVLQDPPILLDNERIVKETGKNYLVISLAYFAVHIYSLDPLRFTTRINGLDAGPVTGEWWL